MAAETKTSGPRLGGNMHKGVSQGPLSGDRAPMGVSLPSSNMDFVRSKVGEEAPTIGPRTA